MCKDFYMLAKKVNEERINDKYNQRKNLNYIAEIEYSKFCIWCRAYKNSEFTEENFKKYQEENNIKINFWVKKRIAELFFDYEFIFVNEKSKNNNKVLINQKWEYIKHKN